MATYTPMMQQYLLTKEQNKDCILFYRLGDFYEMFFEDALIASKELEITLTGKDCGMEERAPMCGIPFHAADNYVNKLVSKGYKVAICEQVEDPKKAKGIVKREVIRTITPGTNTDIQALDSSKNNYLMCVFYSDRVFGVSTVDLSTGDYYVTEVDSVKKIYDEFNRFMPSEIICNDLFEISGIDTEFIYNKYNVRTSAMESHYFDEELCKNKLKEHFNLKVLDGLGLRDYPDGTIAAGALLKYLYDTQKSSLLHLTHITPYESGNYMIIDSSTLRNLELLETLREKQKRGSLLWVLDKTKTAMGARLLRTFISQPLIEKASIEERLDAIEELNSQMITREEIREYLNPIYDLERLISRISLKTAGPRDLLAFKSSINMIQPIKYILKDFKCSELSKVYEQLDDLRDIYDLLEKSISEDAPFSVREGGIIKDGYNSDIDFFRSAKTDGKAWLSQVEAKERDNTGIKNLRVKYNKVFGYYLEVTNSFLNMVPETWIRKQTLTNAERFITPELKELEDKILGAQDKLYALEYDEFCAIRDEIASKVVRIQNTAKAIARIDVFASLAFVCEKNRYVRPTINEVGTINIKDGRHPVIEQMLPDRMFIENDTLLDNDKNRIAIITGPNMAGKSTYMRQSALIVLMAQMGCFVPAKSAEIGLVDRIFTRVGASDDLASGQSTFMVEMTEVANILRNATSNSLIILDEIGRGTSTYDGLSIAWSVVEHLNDDKKIGAKTLFATHYHELTELEGILRHVINYCIAVHEHDDDIIFLRKIIRGGADKSYGIQVAKLAGVPDSVTDRAKEILKMLVEESSNKNRNIENIAVDDTEESPAPVYELPKFEIPEGQMSLFSVSDPIVMNGAYDDIIHEIQNKDLNRMTPIDCMNYLARIQKKIKKKQ